MRTSQVVEVGDPLAAGLDALAAADVLSLDDQTLRRQLLDLVTTANRVHAELSRRVDAFDRRGLAEPDGFRTTKTWVQAFGRLSGPAATRIVAAARLLRSLPKLATAAQTGDVSAEQLQQAARLAGQVGAHRVAEVDATLADAAATLDPARFGLVCARVQAHLDPDGEDPARDFDRRSLTIAACDGTLVLRGQLDPEGGAAVATALDALMTPPADGDARTAGQRRADALVELARRQLSTGALPTVAGHRPQVGVLLHPQALSPGTLAQLADAHQADAAAQRLRELATAAGAQPSRDWTRPGIPIDQLEQIPAGFGHTSTTLRQGIAPPPAGEPASAPPRAGPAPPAWQQPGWADPPWLDWIGPITPATAQRIACDADIWRIILDPATGTPLDVGRRHRLVPHWIRRALHTRDRGCRWPGCPTPATWTDAHHLDPWAEGGETSLQRCLLLCRHHHSLVHEAGWTIDLHPTTGHATITRPEGTPYRPPHTHPTNWNGTTTQATGLAELPVDDRDQAGVGVLVRSRDQAADPGVQRLPRMPVTTQPDA